MRIGKKTSKSSHAACSAPACLFKPEHAVIFKSGCHLHFQVRSWACVTTLERPFALHLTRLHRN